MRSLATTADRNDLVARLAVLTPESQRQWGRMSCAQMICHLADALRFVLGDRPPAPSRSTWLSRTVFRWIFLHTPMPWPREVPTTPEIDQAAGRGTTPGDFTRDRDVLIALMDRFLSLPADAALAPHSFFGPLTRRERERWVWAHTDHHLRQFGA